MPHFILAVKRAKRASVPLDWIDTVRQIPGVKLEGVTSSDRARVEIQNDALAELERAVGEFVHIEPVIRHDRLQR